MSHFAVLCVLGTVDLAEVDDRLAAMLAPYDENMEVAPFRVYLAADEIAMDISIAIGDEEVERRLGTRPTYPRVVRERYEAVTRRISNALRGDDRFSDKAFEDACRADPEGRRYLAEFAAAVSAHDAYRERTAAAFTPAEVVAAWNAKYPGDEDDDGLFLDDTGVYRMSTRNPQSKWDWWLLGGRWTGLLKLRTLVAAGAVGEPGLMTQRAQPGAADAAHVRDVETDGLADRIFAMLTPEGWEAPAEMGWFGMEHGRTEQETAWRERVAQSLANLDPRTVIAVVDCHI